MMITPSKAPANMIDKTATLGQMRHAESRLGNSAKIVSYSVL
jgi:hypothetical protein